MRSGKVMGAVASFAIVLCLVAGGHSRQGPPHGVPPAGPLAAIPISFVLGDGNGNIVGNVVDVSAGFARTLVEVELSSGDRANVLLLVVNGFGFEGIGNVFFSGPNCTGDVFIGAGSFPPAITAAVVTGDDLGSPRKLYVATTDTLVSATVQSSQFGFDGCFNFPPVTTDLLPAELVDSDLEMTFPPPYTLEIE